MVCNGKVWWPVVVGVPGVQGAGKTCLDILNQTPGAKDGLYMLNPDGAGALTLLESTALGSNVDPGELSAPHVATAATVTSDVGTWSPEPPRLDVAPSTVAGITPARPPAAADLATTGGFRRAGRSRQKRAREGLELQTGSTAGGSARQNTKMKSRE